MIAPFNSKFKSVQLKCSDVVMMQFINLGHIFSDTIRVVFSEENDLISSDYYVITIDETNIDYFDDVSLDDVILSWKCWLDYSCSSSSQSITNRFRDLLYSGNHSVFQISYISY